jgi:hypothetical protein
MPLAEGSERAVGLGVCHTKDKSPFKSVYDPALSNQILVTGKGRSESLVVTNVETTVAKISNATTFHLNRYCVQS